MGAVPDGTNRAVKRVVPIRRRVSPTSDIPPLHLFSVVARTTTNPDDTEMT